MAVQHQVGVEVAGGQTAVLFRLEEGRKRGGHDRAAEDDGNHEGNDELDL